MKLELKHLAPYLPYGLHIKHNEGAKLIICGAFKKHNADDFFTYSLLNWKRDVKSTEAKPILRSLSDLFNGNYEFILDEFSEMSLESFKIAFLSDLRPLNAFDKINYTTALLLLENHFDVFNLHENGLCIYYNEL